jgi:photosystem II stability/assembly factor-like uncharacterized protein
MGLARSLTAGQTWQSYRNVAAFANDGIYAVAMRDTVVWASTGFLKEIAGGSRVQTGSGYAFSLDRGDTWQHVGQTIDSQSDTVIPYGLDTLRALPVIVPEQNVTFDISIGPSRVWIASWASGLRYTTDNGQSWRRVLLPPDDRNHIAPRDNIWNFDTLNFYVDPRRNNNFLAFSVLTIDDSTIWVGTAGGVNKSTDGGASWTRMTRRNQQSSILGNWVIAIKEQRFRNVRRTWTTNWRADDPAENFGVSYTEDGGRTWTNLLHGVKAYEFAFKDSIAYIATEEGLYRTSDGGISFTRSGTIIDPTTREMITTSSVYAVGVLGDIVWVGTSDGMASTVDDGITPFGSIWKIYRTYEPVGVAPRTYAYPNPFSPSSEAVRIHYSTGGQNAEATVEVFDFAMNPVRTVIRTAARSGSVEHDELWDGRDDGGRSVANGVYFYRVRVSGRDPMWGKVMVLR